MIEALPSGDDTWRVDWFGSVDYGDRMKRSQQPLVQVYLSKVKRVNPERTFHKLIVKLGTVDELEIWKAGA